MRKMRCAYDPSIPIESLSDSIRYSGRGPCSGPVIVTLHDGRGCYDLCLGHLEWRLTKSIMFGHSSQCPVTR